ncbi:MAG: cytochrome c-type biogenesis protein CcmH [Rhodospirillaceae bacterium]|nr:cytochrome c-type biogenesis protein CcmH [Rhodospirillaceae bacterium]
MAIANISFSGKNTGRKIMKPFLLPLVLMMLFTTSAQTVEPNELLEDPRLETRARALSVDIRCLVCQNQSIDDSDADLAKDLRKLVRKKLKEGASDEDIRNYLVTRYGEFVLLRPRIASDTYILWFGPIIILLAGIIGIFIFFRRHSQRDSIQRSLVLSEDEEKRISELINNRG